MTDPAPPLSYCPNCQKKTVEAHQPFCSKRCADIDLGQWFNGSYSIPAVTAPDDWSEQHPTEGTENQWNH